MPVFMILTPGIERKELQYEVAATALASASKQWIRLLSGHLRDETGTVAEARDIERATDNRAVNESFMVKFGVMRCQMRA